MKDALRSRARLLLALAVTAPFWDLGHPLWEVDDARYAEVPREMYLSGGWLRPTLNFVDYVEKPPLIYWLGAASYRLFGVSEAAARVPLALLALAGLAGAWWLGRWLYGPATGLGAALILGTCAQFFALEHLLTPDMAVSVCLLWATGLVLRCLREPERGALWGALAWLAMAGAFFAKGLIGLLLPCAWTLGLLALFPELRKGVRPLLLNWGLPLFALALWGFFAAMEDRHPGFFRFFVVEQHFQRYLTPKYNRPGGWYYFFAVELAGWLPWTPLAVTAALAPLARARRADPRDLQLALWVAGVFAFFCVSSSKLVTYILPLFAHQAVLAAALLERLDESPAENAWIRGTGWALAVPLAAALVAAGAVLPRLHLPFAPAAALLAAALALLACLLLGTLAWACDARGEGAPLTRCAAAALGCCAMLALAGRQLGGQLSVRELAQGIEEAAARAPAGAPARVWAYDKYLHGIPFYTGRPVRVINWVGELHYAKRFARFADRFGDDAAVRALPEPGAPTLITVERRRLRQLLELNPDEPPVKISFYGPWALVEY